MTRLPRLVTATTLAVGMALATAPAIAQGTRPPTIYTFSLPGSVNPSATSFTISGAVSTKKSRGDTDMGKVPLAAVATKLSRLQEKGRSVGGLVTINGKTREFKGAPVVLANGNVKVRVVQGRGTRALVVPRRGGSASAASCPSGYIMVTIASTPPEQMCVVAPPS